MLAAGPHRWGRPGCSGVCACKASRTVCRISHSWATCQSGSSTTERGHPEGQAMGGLAQCLVHDLGMPAVLAMTDLVTVSTVRALTASFYRRLLEHGEPDLALVEATAGL